MKTSSYNLTSTLASAAAFTLAAALSLPANADSLQQENNGSIGGDADHPAPVSDFGGTTIGIGGALPGPSAGDGSDPANNGWGIDPQDPSAGDGSDPANNGWGTDPQDPSAGDGSDPANNGWGTDPQDPSAGDGSVPPTNNGFGSDPEDPSAGDGSVLNSDANGFGQDPDDPTIADELCDYDLNADHRVDEQDLAILLKAWGTSLNVADGNDDGLVDALDMISLIAEWGMCQ